MDQVRDAQHLLSRAPLLGKYRISLFPGFQAATPSAQNALLKTLEEAPAHAVMVLTADEPEQLLPTIVSRCEVLRLKPVGIPRVEQCFGSSAWSRGRRTSSPISRRGGRVWQKDCSKMMF